MKLWITGDAHGDWFHLWHAAKAAHLGKADALVVAGDFGFGFPSTMSRPPYDMPLPVWWIRGNHDNPEAEFDWGEPYRKLEDPTREGRVLFVGGGNSVESDRKWRTPGLDWWPGEEVTRASIDQALQMLDGVEVVVTHDTPDELYPRLYTHHTPSLSSTELNVLAKALHDRGGDVLWLHGHHHEPQEHRVGNILYRCLAPIHNQWDGPRRFQVLLTEGSAE